MNIRDMDRVIIYYDYYARPWMSQKDKLRVVSAALRYNNGYLAPQQLKLTPEQLWESLGIHAPTGVSVGTEQEP